MKAFFAKLLGISQAIWDFIAPILARQASITLSKLLPIALGICADLAKQDGLSGAQKREKAFNDLSAFATAEGFEVANSLINLSIEMAVNKLKSVE